MPVVTTLKALGGVLSDAGRVLVQHGPQLVGLFLLGWIGRLGFLWLAIAVMPLSPTLSVLIMPLAPMATLLSLVLMVRATGETLPAFADVFAATQPRERLRSDLTVAAQVLLPFLAVYAAQGLLKADTRMFLVESNTDMFLNEGQWTRAGDYASGPFLIGMIVIAIVLRKIIGLLDLGKKSIGWAFAATFLEVLWVVTLAQALSSQLTDVTDWVTSRIVIAQALELWHGLTALIPTIPLLSTIVTFIAEAGNLIIVPVSWLALGATVFGTKLKEDENFGRFSVLADHDTVTQRLQRIPSPVRRYAAQAVEPVTTPVKDALTALGQVAAAGVLPMVMVCLIFAFVSQVKVVIAWAFRALFGAGDPWFVWALTPFSDFLQAFAYFVLTMALLGAAVNAVVLGEKRRARAAAETAAAQEAADASEAAGATTA